MAKLEQPKTEIFVNKLLLAAERKLSDFDAQNIDNTLWALAMLDHRPNTEAFVIKLLYEAERKLPGFNAQNLANTSWALATLRHHDGGFISSVARPAHDLKLGAKHISQLVIGLSRLGYDDPAFYDSVGSQLMSCPDLDLQAMSYTGLPWPGCTPLGPWNC